MRQTLYLDIETLPAPESVMAGIEVNPPGNIKKPESIAKWLAEEGEAKKRELWERTALDGWQGTICVAAWAVGDGRVHHATGEEAGILKSIFGAFKPGVEVICGHHIGWDLEFIKRRAVALGVSLPMTWPVNEKPWSERVRCTMRLAMGDRESISLDLLCQRLGIPGKGGFDGSMVAEAWANGERQKVIDYCIADVERVRQLDRRFRAVGI